MRVCDDDDDADVSVLYQDDHRKRLRSGSTSDHHDLARILSLPNDSGPEHIMTGDEYLQPRSNGVVPAATANNPPVSIICILLTLFCWRLPKKFVVLTGMWSWDNGLGL